MNQFTTVRLRRTRQTKLPAGTVCVTRTAYGPGKFGNPFKVGKEGTPPTNAEAVQSFREWLDNTPEGQDMAFRAKRDLRGKNLACWCRIGDPCHADVLLELANQP